MDITGGGGECDEFAGHTGGDGDVGANLFAHSFRLARMRGVAWWRAI